MLIVPLFILHMEHLNRLFILNLSSARYTSYLEIQSNYSFHIAGNHVVFIDTLE